VQFNDTFQQNPKILLFATLSLRILGFCNAANNRKPPKWCIKNDISWPFWGFTAKCPVSRYYLSRNGTEQKNTAVTLVEQFCTQLTQKTAILAKNVKNGENGRFRRK